MPKVKTRKSAVKRFKVSGSGKLLRRQAGQKHLLTKKRRRRIRALKGTDDVHPTDMDRVIEQLPYLKYAR